MDPELQALLSGGGGESKVIDMPVQRIEGDPEAGMSALGRLGKMLSPTPAQNANYDAWKGQEHPGLVDSAGDVASGVAGGLTAHLDQRIPFGIGDAIREDRAQATGRNPGLMAGADMLGAVASPIGIEGRGASLLGTVGRAAANGGMQAAARSAGDAGGDEDMATQVWKALGSGAQGAGVSGAFAGATGLLGSGLDKVSSWLGEASDKARTAAIGASGADLGKLAKNRGLDFVEGNVGRMPEELGVTNTLLPVSTSGYAKRFAERGSQANDQITGALADADRQVADLVPGQSRANIVAGIDRSSDAAGASAFGDRGSYQRALDDVRTGVDQQTLDKPSDLRALKTQLDSRAYPNALQGSSESITGQAHTQAAAAVRDELRGVMSQAAPETNAAFTQGNQDYGKSAMLEDLATKRAAGQYAGGGMLGNLGSSAVGAGVGGMFGGLSGAAAGAGLGMVRPALAAAQQYGPDFGANLGRLGERATGSLGGAASQMADSAGIAKLGGLLAAEHPVQAQDRELGNDSRGHLIPEAIQHALQTNQLGPYSDKFARAAMSDTPGALGALYQTLSSDPGFAPYRRVLQQLTAGGER